MNLALLLPQTLYQVWGISFQNKISVYQFEYPLKHKRAHEIALPIYRLNSQILELIEESHLTFIKSSDNIELVNFTFDEQLLNLISYFPNLKIRGEKSVIHYTSNPHRAIQFTDLVFGLEYARQLYRNIKYFTSVRPKKVYSVDYKWTRNRSFNQKFLWKNIPIDVNSIKSKSVEFLNRFKKEYPELSDLYYQPDPLIICPGEKQKIDSFKDWVRLNYVLFEPLNKNIFIKHHRVADEIYPNSFRVNDTNFITLNTPIMRVLPLEILLHAIGRLQVITPPSSISAFGERIKLITPFTKDENKAYGLLHKQLNRHNRLEFFN